MLEDWYDTGFEEEQDCVQDRDGHEVGEEDGGNFESGCPERRDSPSQIDEIGKQRRHGHDLHLSPRWGYIPTGALEGFNTSPAERRSGIPGLSDVGPSARVDELYDEEGFLIEDESHEEVSTSGDEQRVVDKAWRYSSDPREQYPKYVMELGSTQMTRGEFRQWQEDARRRSPEQGDTQRRFAPVLQNTKQPRHGLHEWDDGARRSSLNPEACCKNSATELMQTGSIEHGDKDGTCALEEHATISALEKSGVLPEGQDKERRGEALRKAPARAEQIALNRRGTNFSWDSSIVEETVVYSRDIVVAEKRRRYEQLKGIGMAGSDGNLPRLQALILSRTYGHVKRGTVTLNELQAFRKGLRQSRLLRRAHLLRRTVSLNFELGAYPEDLHGKQERAADTNDEPVEFAGRLSADAVSEHREMIERQAGAIRELPEHWAQTAQRRGVVLQKSWEAVQYSVESSHPLALTFGSAPERAARMTEPARAPRTEVDALGVRRSVPAGYCVQCSSLHVGRVANAQDSVIENFHPLKDVCRTARAQDGKNVLEVSKDETIGMNQEQKEESDEKQPLWCWPFGRTRRASGLYNVLADSKRGSKKGNSWIWKTKAERRKLFKQPPPPNALPAS